jgi:hypothetical protein
MNGATYLLLGVIPFLASCASETVVSDLVGPNPVQSASSAGAGYLRVFSKQEPMTEGFDGGANPTYYQPSDYRVYDGRGKLVRYVSNSAGKYDPTPRLVSLAPGSYIVKARAKDYLAVQVPVVIQRGQTTSVHLDDRWTPPAGANANELVVEPNGNPIGWRAYPSRQHAEASQDQAGGVG